MDKKDKKANSAAEARNKETESGKPTLQDTGPKGNNLQGDGFDDDKPFRLKENEIEDTDTEYKTQRSDGE